MKFIDYIKLKESTDNSQDEIIVNPTLKLKIKPKNEFGEFEVVVLRKNGNLWRKTNDDESYYTNNMADAIGTMQAMANNYR